MKKRIFRITLSLLMAIVMLYTTLVSTAALAISAPSEEEPAWTLSYDDGVISLKIDPEVLYDILEDKTLTKEELQKLIPEEVLTLIENKDSISPEAVADIIKNYISADDLKAMIDDIPVDMLKKLIDVELIEAIITIEEVVSLFDLAGMFESVEDVYIEEMFAGDPMDKVLTDRVVAELEANDFGEIDPDNILVSDIANAVGGYDSLLALYSASETSALISAVGAERIMAFVKDSDLLSKIDIKGILNDIIDHVKDRKEEFKTLVKTVALRAVRLLINDVDTISINGKTVFDGQFDINAILVALLQGIPDIEDLVSLGTDATIASYILEVKLMESKYPEKYIYNYGFEVGFMGDPTELLSLIEPYANMFVFDVSDDLDVDMSVTLPTVASVLYEKLLLSDRTASIKGLLLSIPTTSISDVGNKLSSITDEQLQGVVDTVVEKADEIREKAYAKIDETDLPAEAVEKAKKGIDKIIDNLLTLERAKQLRDKTVELLDKLPAKVAEKTLDDFYSYDEEAKKGSFRIGEQSFSVDLFEQISKVITIPEDVKIYFKDESMVISGTVDIEMAVNGLHRLQLMNADGSESTYFLPEGIDLSVLGVGGIMDERLEAVTNMPAEDSYLYSDGLYSVTFAGDTEDIIRIYAKGQGHTVEEPAVLDYVIIEGGYKNYRWVEYELDVVKRLTVTYTADKIEDDYVSFVDVNGKNITESIVYDPSVSVEELIALHFDELKKYESMKNDAAYYYYEKADDFDDAQEKLVYIIYKYKITFNDSYTDKAYTIDFDSKTEQDSIKADIAAYKAQFENGRPSGVTKYSTALDEIKLDPDTFEQKIDVTYTYTLTFYDAETGERIGGDDEVIEFSPKEGMTQDDIRGKLDALLKDGHENRDYIDKYEFDAILDKITAPANQDVYVAYTYMYYLVFKDEYDNTLFEERFVPAADATFDNVKDENGNALDLDKLIMDSDPYNGQAIGYELEPSKENINFTSPTQFEQPIKVTYNYEYAIYFQDQYQSGEANFHVIPFDPETQVINDIYALLTEEHQRALSGHGGVDYVFAYELTANDDYYELFPDEKAPVFNYDTLNASKQFKQYVKVIYIYEMTFLNADGVQIGNTVEFAPYSGLTVKDIADFRGVDFTEGGIRPASVYTGKFTSTFSASTLPKNTAYTATVNYEYTLVIKDAKDKTKEPYGTITFEPKEGLTIDKYTNTIKGMTSNVRDITYSDIAALNAMLGDYTQATAEIEVFVEFKYKVIIKSFFDPLKQYKDFDYTHADADTLAHIEADMKAQIKAETGAVDVIFVTEPVNTFSMRRIVQPAGIEWEPLNLSEINALPDDGLTTIHVVLVGKVTLTDKNGNSIYYENDDGNTVDYIEFYEGVTWKQIAEMTAGFIEDEDILGDVECFAYALDENDFSGFLKDNSEELIAIEHSTALIVRVVQEYGRINFINSADNSTVSVLYDDNDTVQQIKDRAGIFEGEGTRYEFFDDRAFERVLDIEDGVIKSLKHDTVSITYTKTDILYYISFVDKDGNIVGDVISYKYDDIDDVNSKKPNVPQKPNGYDDWKWESFGLGYVRDQGDPQVVRLIYTLIDYTYTFKDKDGNPLNDLTITYTVETDSITIPSVPAIDGYENGTWDGLVEYVKGQTLNVTATAKYDLIIYEAIFKADGKEVGKVPYTVEDTVPLAGEPKVPEKVGFTGKWEDYSIKVGGMTVNAVYTPVSSDSTDIGTGTGTGSSTDTATGDLTSAVTTAITPAPIGGCGGGSWWWILLVIILVVIIILVILLIIKNNRDDEPPTPPVAPPPTPEPEPEPEPAPEPKPEPKPMPVVPAQPHILSSTSRGIINLCDLEEYFEAGDTVSLEVLKEKNLVSKNEKRLKILGNGVVTKPMTVIADYFSGSAKEKILEAGGTPIEKE